MKDIRPTQIRMARAALGWSIKDLSEKTNLHRNTIYAAEKKGAIVSEATSNLLRNIFQENGLMLIDQDEFGPGIRHKQPTP